LLNPIDRIASLLIPLGCVLTANYRKKKLAVKTQPRVKMFIPIGCVLTANNQDEAACEDRASSGQQKTPAWLGLGLLNYNIV